MSMPTCLLVRFSHVQLYVTPWTVAHQAPLPMELYKQEYWSRLPFPTSGGLPNPGIKPESPVAPAMQADSLPLSHRGSPIQNTRGSISYLHFSGLRREQLRGKMGK